MAWAEAGTGTTRVTETVFLGEAQYWPPSQGPDHRLPGSSCPVLVVPLQSPAPLLLFGLKPLFCTCHPCEVCLFMPPVDSFSTCLFVSLSGPLPAGPGAWGLAGSAAPGPSLPWAASEHAAVTQAGPGGSWLSPPAAGSPVRCVLKRGRCRQRGLGKMPGCSSLLSRRKVDPRNDSCLLPCQLLPVWQPPLWSPDSTLPSKPRFHTELLKGKFPSLSHCWRSSPPHHLGPPIPCTLPCFLPCRHTALSWSSQMPTSFLPQDLCTCCFLCLDCLGLLVSRGSVWLFRALFRCRHLLGALPAFSELLLREPPPGQPFPNLPSVVPASMTLIMIRIYYLLICLLGYHPFSQ
ncbi:serine/threonine-protein phosphatase 2A activator isoform X1 [Mustela lutreola]|uniref:serine/threonine-protein phosphatase 2A activator isoform X1 n=1 Tax=Mustela lutreola TaxID=9666 RepID=UPI0027972F47|nr:serine/threonine-protein phosphatase 2A activator isoform X1 [Mustela lutreola]